MSNKFNELIIPRLSHPGVTFTNNGTIELEILYGRNSGLQMSNKFNEMNYSLQYCPKPGVTFTNNGTIEREITIETDPNFVSAGYVPGDTMFVLWWLRAEAFDKENGRCFLPCRLDSFKIESIPISNAVPNIMLGKTCCTISARPNHLEF